MPNRTKIDATEKRPRGRPKAYDPQAALAQATEAFWKAGYAGTSLDDIASATGMNRPSLRAAFGDKRDLYLRTLADYWARKFELMHKALDGDECLTDSLMKVYEASLAVYFMGDGPARGCFVVGTAITEANSDPDVQRMVADGFRTLDACFEKRLTRAVAEGELPEGSDAVTLALLATATMHSIAVRARTGTPRAELRAMARRAVDTICGG
ncbi:TetR/AcrR family transcriptional regulator [Rothia nasimurium]|uniref:TetR/AcrR family transcriptional regulator n=1 Tax=Luteibacter anthropi TaxID=564369 RepID=A0A7X5UCI3_9GAMM|nr:TetR/AcrR family transcriptional regulator [Luteibacter anthropi]NII07964.1 TetR/AcrR family transcriptional regulator [Luteibacter anthropi]